MDELDDYNIDYLLGTKPIPKIKPENSVTHQKYNIKGIPEIITKELHRKIYVAIYFISKLTPTIRCVPHVRTIRKYLTGKPSKFYDSFKSKPYFGTSGAKESMAINDALDEMVEMGVLRVIEGKRDTYKINSYLK